jgi:hypothetical protein
VLPRHAPFAAHETRKPRTEAWRIPLNGPYHDRSRSRRRPSFDRPDAVSVRETEIRDFASGARYQFPAHSLTVITATVR